MTEAGALRVRYFAWLREELGQAAEEVAVPRPADIETLIATLKTRGPAWEGAFAPGRRVRAAVNQRFVGPRAALAAGDEVAFFPPVTGG